MKWIIAAAVLFQAVIAQSQQDKNAKIIIKYESVADVLGNYKFSFEMSSGISVELIRKLKITEYGRVVLQVEGMYFFYTPKGSFLETDYISDENGHRIINPMETDRSVETTTSLSSFDLENNETTATTEELFVDRFAQAPLSSKAIQTLQGRG